MICELDTNDFCARHERRHLGRMKELALDPSEKGERYRNALDLAVLNQKIGIAKRVAAQLKPLGQGPGTELMIGLNEAKFSMGPNCQCEARARQMNAWGVQGCREHRGEIIGWLIETAIQSELFTEASKSDKMAHDFIGGMVDEAIKRAEEKAVQPSVPFVPGVAVPRYIGLEKPIIRNMLMHIWPRKGNGVWQWNVQQVLKRIELFDGKRIVAIATDSQSDSADAVKQAFGGKITTFIELTNNPGRREVETFLPLFSQVQSLAKNEVTCYLQSKGTTRGLGHTNGTTATYWAEMMYEGLLDYWPEVERILDVHPICGMFKKVGHGFAGSRSEWHYSGSFFWFANHALFSRNWREIDQIRFGIEPYPSLHFGRDEAGCLFMEGIVGVCNDRNRAHAMANRHLEMYDWRYCMEHAKPHWEEWKAKHAT